MKEITQFENLDVEIRRKARQKHMHLRVNPDGKVRVTCNKRRTMREILGFVSESREFIAKRFLHLEAMKKRFPPKQMLSGENFLLLGAPAKLEVVWGWNEKIKVGTFDDENLQIRIEIKAPLGSSPKERLQALKNFLKREARKLLDERTWQYAKQMGLYPKKISVRGQSTRWGSCTQSGHVSLNWKLLCAPIEVIDYVVIHELAHLEHLNHSTEFWNLVEQNHPEFKRCKKWLKTHEPEIARQFD